MIVDKKYQMFGVTEEGCHYSYSITKDEVAEITSWDYDVWIFFGTYGAFSYGVGNNLQDAMDNAVDENRFDSMLLSQTEHAEFIKDDREDEIVYLGNASEPFYNDFTAQKAIVVNYHQI